jgi:hypothetical protein
MKAQHVYENVHFQRGGSDVKYSIGVGRTTIYKQVEDDIKDIVIKRILPPLNSQDFGFRSQYKAATEENILVTEIATEDWDNEKIYSLKKSIDSELRWATEYLREYLHNIWDISLTDLKTKFPIVTLGIMGRDVIRRRGSDQNSYIRIFYKK